MQLHPNPGGIGPQVNECVKCTLTWDSILPELYSHYVFYRFSRHNEAKNFKPVTLPGQEAAADYQVKLFALELKNNVLCCMFQIMYVLNLSCESFKSQLK